MSSEQPVFDHANIADFRQPFPVIDEGFYNLQLVAAEKREGVSKETGKPYLNYNLRLRIVNDDQFSGRVFFSTQWPGNKFGHGLFRISEATGIDQNDGETVEEFLQKVIDAGDSGVFKSKVTKKINDFKSKDLPKGQEVYENDVNLMQVQVADAMIV